MVTQHWPARENSEEARKQREEGGERKISRKREREKERCTIVVTMVTSRGFLEKNRFYCSIPSTSIRNTSLL